MHLLSRRETECRSRLYFVSVELKEGDWESLLEISAMKKAKDMAITALRRVLRDTTNLEFAMMR